MAVDRVLDHAHLLTMAPVGLAGPLAGKNQAAVAEIADGALAIDGGRIAAVGPREEVLAGAGNARIDDLGGRVVTPGLVDAHTHPVWAGSRVDEFVARAAGADYVALAKAGGGIASTVRATRAATDDELLSATRGRLDRLLDHGVTTVEAKTGYGLSLEEELRQLRILGVIAEEHAPRVVATFLGAHAVPPEYAGRADAYVDLVVEEMLPAVARDYPGVFCDVFCDDGAFTLTQTERILRRARELQLPLKAHADEFAHLGCTTLAAELGAVSCDHLVAVDAADMAALAAAGTVAVLLPGTTFGLASTRYAPGRVLVDHGVPVALGTDLNPGTCPCPNLPFMVALAVRMVGLTPAEAFVAVTRNAAFASGRGLVAGRLSPGRPADIAVFDTTDYRDVAYEFAINPVAGTMVDGRWTGGRW